MLGEAAGPSQEEWNRYLVVGALPQRVGEPRPRVGGNAQQRAVPVDGVPHQHPPGLLAAEIMHAWSEWTAFPHNLTGYCTFQHRRWVVISPRRLAALR